MSIDQQQVGPAVIVKIYKHSAPTEILSMQAEAGGISHVIKRAVAVVAVKRSGIGGKICFENIELAVAIKVTNGRSHAGLLAAVFIESGAGRDRHVCKRPIAIVVIKNARRAVARDVDVPPAVVIKIERRNAKCVMS